MAYMVYQQYKTAVNEAYRGHHEVADHARTARSFRDLIATLEIDTRIRDVLVEQATELEEAFAGLAARSDPAS